MNVWFERGYRPIVSTASFVVMKGSFFSNKTFKKNGGRLP